MNQNFSWEAKEFQFQKKSADWYWALGIIAFSGAAAAFIFNNILFGILVILGSFVLAIYATMKPRNIKFEVSGRGVSVGNTLYPYQTLKSFWINDELDQPVLLIESKRALVPLIIIPINSVPPENVRSLLLEYMEEVEHELPIADKLLERIGF